MTRRLALLTAGLLAAFAVWRLWPRPAPTTRDVNRLLQARRHDHHGIVSWTGPAGPLVAHDAGLGRARVTLRSPQRDRSCSTLALLAAQGWLEDAGYRVTGEAPARVDGRGSLLVHPRTGSTPAPFGTRTGLLAFLRSLWIFARRRRVGEAVAFGPGERWIVTWAHQADGAPRLDRGATTIPASAPGGHRADRHFTTLVLRLAGPALALGVEPRPGRRWPSWWAQVRRLWARPSPAADLDRVQTSGHTTAADLSSVAGRGIEVGPIMGVRLDSPPDTTVRDQIVAEAVAADRHRLRR